MREESNFVFQNGLGSTSGNLSNILLEQAIPDKQKTEKWKKSNMDVFERIGQTQFRENMKFKDYYDMIAGRLTYLSSGLGDYDLNTSPFSKDVKKISEDKGIPTYLKHYDFIGIVVNALVGLYMDFQDVFRVDSNDEYFTNDYIRQKTELLYKYGQETFQAELQRLLVGRGVDLEKNDFKSQEEADQYNQYVEQQKKALTPPEIEITMAKNFKILATEWAQNTLKADEADFYLQDLDKLNFIDKLLTGRFFRHYVTKYDSYDIERWKPTNTFFAQNENTRFPQEGEYCGHTEFMSPSDIINKFGYLLTAKEQENLSNYWGQKETNTAVGSGSFKNGLFERHTVPFNNYYDHELLSQYESALGMPLAERTILGQDGDDKHYRDWLPQYGDSNQLHSSLANYHREDIKVNTSAIQVTQVYWRSYKRMGLLIYENEQGVMSMTVVTDDLLPEFLTRYEIKKLKEVTLDEVERATKSNNLNDYINTIVYNYTPEIWKGVKLKNTSHLIKDDIYLDIRPLDFQIRGGRSNVYNFLLPVGGIIGDSLVMKMTPYQIMHNMLMNQMQDITEKEIGMFFIFDVNFLPSEFLQGGDQHSALLEMREFAKDAGFLPVDKSKQNAPTSQNVNTFERIDLSYGQQLEYKRVLAEYYKQEGLKQIGITPQVLGSPNTYTSTEGIKQGAQGSFIQIQQIFEEFNTAKCKMMDIHLAVAQYCQSNGKDNTVLTTKSDGDHYFLDIVKEDEHFSMRSLGVRATTSSKDRKILETAKQIMTQDNTISKDLLDTMNIISDPTIVELRHNLQVNRDRNDKMLEDKRQHELSLQQEQIKSQEQQIKRAEDIKISEAQKDRDSKEQIAYMTGISKAVDDNGTMEGLEYLKMENARTSKLEEVNAKINLKQQEINSQENQNKETTNFKFQELAEKTKIKREEMALRERENNSKTFRDINSYNQ